MSYETLTMHWLDWLVVVAFFVLVLGIGILSGKKVKNSSDFFVGGGKVPWWLSGISHHVSGYSGVVFVGYAGIAYSQGISIYFWWAVVIAISVAVGAVLVAPRWPRLRRALGIQSVTEYLVHNQIELLNHIKGDDRMTRDIVTLPTMCQFRTTRHIDGEYTLTEDDAYLHFEDSVGAICDFDRRDYLYEVPFGTLVHRDFPNLITAGRTAAGQGYAWDVLRVIPPAIVTGQAAGEAAVLAVETGSAIAAVNLEELQRRLVAGGMPLHFDDALIPQEESGSDRQEDIGHI